MTPPDEPGDTDPRVVPVYALTGGRARPRGTELHIETLVTATPDGADARGQLRFEHARIVDLCRNPLSVVEIAARLQIPLSVARVLVSDLHADGHLTVHRVPETIDGRPGAEVLERLLSGLRSR
jgi:hypothetical protein